MSDKERGLIHTIAAEHQIAVDEAALKKAEEYIEAEEGATNRLAGFLGRFVMAVAVVMSLVPPLRGVRHRADAAAAHDPRRLRPVPGVPAVPVCPPLPPPRHVVGLDCRRAVFARHRLRSRRRRRFHRPQHHPDQSGHGVRRHPDAAGSGGGAPRHRAGSCRSSACCSSPTRCSARTWARRGRIAATTFRGSSATCT